MLSLKRMFSLAVIAGKAANCPRIAKLEENNTRKGFFELEQFNSVLRHLPVDLKPMAETSYIIGWWIVFEIFNSPAPPCGSKGWMASAGSRQTKNREGRMFPLTPRLRAILEEQIARTEALQRATGQIIPWSFHREGKHIKNFRRAWRTALAKAGFGREIRAVS
jgi:hypothetical protein